MNTRTLALICALSASVPQAWAATYYVKSTGSDSNDGLSDGNAWATLHKASTGTSNGDTILLNRGDTWTVTAGARATGATNPGDGCVVGIGLSFSNTTSAGCSGSTPTANVTIGAYGSGAKPIITSLSNNESGDMDKLHTNYAPINIGGYNATNAGGFVVENLDLRGPRYGPAIQMHDGGDGNTISNCDISGKGWAAESLVQFNGDNHIIQDSFFDQIDDAVEEYSKAFEWRGGSGHIARRNIFKGFGSGGAVRHSNGGTGTVLIERNFFYEPNDLDDWAWAIVVRDRNGGTVVIRNNVISLVGSTHTGSDLRGMAFWGDVSDSVRKIFNNTIVSDGDGYGLDGTGSYTSSTSDVYAYNNIFYDLAQGWNGPGDGNTTLRQNVWYSVTLKTDETFDTEVGSVTTNPNLSVPAMSNDLASDADLTVSSTNSIDSGYESDGDIPSVDYDGTTRSDVDIGAFEYGAGGGGGTIGAPRAGVISPIYRMIW